jgi:hypothetical protein
MSTAMHTAMSGDGLMVDVLAPDGVKPPPTVGAGRRAVGIPGGSQALARQEEVAVTIGDRELVLRRPTLLGAILIKAAVIGTDGSATPQATHAQIARIARRTADLLGVRELRDEELVLDDRWYASTYGIPDDKTVGAIRLAGRLEGMLTDPVYEGKWMAAMIDLKLRRDRLGLHRALRAPRCAAGAQRLRGAVHVTRATEARARRRMRPPVCSRVPALPAVRRCPPTVPLGRSGIALEDWPRDRRIAEMHTEDIFDDVSLLLIQKKAGYGLAPRKWRAALAAIRALPEAAR